MIICSEKDEWEYYHLCKIKYFFIYKNLKSFIIFGERIIVNYDQESGLYEENNIIADNPYICKQFENVLNVEPLLHLNLSSDPLKTLYYFKSAPYDA